MKNKEIAVIVGGSNGIGLAIAKEFMNRGYFAQILDVAEPDGSLEVDEAYRGNYGYQKFDLLDFNEEIIKKLACANCAGGTGEMSGDADAATVDATDATSSAAGSAATGSAASGVDISAGRVTALMITAGFGRVADFEYLDTAEIDRMLTVNTIGGIKLVRLFYDRIKSGEDFYCGMMGSIAGLISSPMFAVYAASKAAICRFIESVNIELEVYGTPNRILNVSPGSIKGTRFNGAEENDLELNQGLAADIVDKLLAREELFIPDYDAVYKGVLERYHADAHAFGRSSYEYKLQSGRVRKEK